MEKNTIRLNAYIQKRDRSDFTDEQTLELSQRIEAVVKTLGFVFVEPVEETEEVGKGHSDK